MEVKAISRSVRISPRKVRIVAAVLKGSTALEAVRKLSLLDKRGATILEKTVKSAIANAVNNAKLTEEKLVIKEIQVNEGAFLKRFHHSTRGRVHPYKRRSSHITVVLEDK